MGSFKWVILITLLLVAVSSECGKRTGLKATPEFSFGMFQGTYNFCKSFCDEFPRLLEDSSAYSKERTKELRDYFYLNFYSRGVSISYRSYLEAILAALLIWVLLKKSPKRKGFIKQFLPLVLISLFCLEMYQTSLSKNHFSQIKKNDPIPDHRKYSICASFQDSWEVIQTAGPKVVFRTTWFQELKSVYQLQNPPKPRNAIIFVLFLLIIWNLRSHKARANIWKLIKRRKK